MALWRGNDYQNREVRGEWCHGKRREQKQGEKICFLAKDEKEAREIAKEWMLGQMLLNYKDFREVALFLANRLRTIKEIENGNC